jgi:hypothetical protein
MRLTLTHAQAASGPLAGVSASSTRQGARLAARVPRLQPRTPSQQSARHFTGSLPALWRTLTSSQRAAWSNPPAHVHSHAALAHTSQASGYPLFVACNRRLLTLGLPPVLSLPSQPPAVPPIRSFTATPAYNQAIPPQYLTSFPVYLDPTIPAPYFAVIRATMGLSPAKHHIRQSDLRIVAAIACGNGNTVDTYPGWVAAFGAPLPFGIVAFVANLLDPRTGFAGPRVRCSAAYATLPIPVIQPGTVTISQNGTIIAIEPDTLISFGGVPVAGA